MDITSTQALELEAAAALHSGQGLGIFIFRAYI